MSAGDATKPETDPNTYWINLQGDELCAAILLHFRQFEEDLWRTGDYENMELFRLAYYGQDKDGTSTSRTDPLGAAGQARSLRSNELRRAVKNKLTIALADPPATMPVPANTDTDAINQAQIGVALVNSYMDEGVDGILVETAEINEGLGWGWLDAPWDDGLGDPVDGPDTPGGEQPVLDETTGEMIGVRKVRTGDLRFIPRLPIDVAFEMQSRNTTPPNWVIIRGWENKFSLAAQVEAARPGDPEAKEAAGAIRSLSATEVHSTIRFGRYFTTVHTDEIEIYELRAKDSPAVDGGRIVRMCGTNIILPIPHLERAAQEGLLSRPDANPYGMRVGSDLGCEMTKADVRYGTPRGYTDSLDCLGLQRAVDVLTSAAYSNQRAHGGNVLFYQKGSGLEPKMLNESLTAIAVNDISKVPVVAELLDTPKEVFEFRETLMQELAQTKGLNGVSQGTDTRDLSGAAFALLDTQTQRAVGNTAKEAWRVRQWAANTIIQQVQRFGRGTRRAVLRVGKATRPKLMELKPDELKGLYRVDMERTAGIQRSPAGRLQMAQDLLASRGQDGKPNINGEQYVAVVTTGKLEPLTEGPMSALTLIRSENERLAAGEMLDEPAPMGPDGRPMLDPATGMPMPPRHVQADAGDDHPLHIREHGPVLSSPEARRNPAVVRAVNAHRAAHVSLWRSTDPALLMAANVPLPPPPPGMMPPPGAGGPAPAEGGGGDAGAAPGPGTGPTESAAPNLPTNPSTGEQWSPTGAVGDA